MMDLLGLSLGADYNGQAMAREAPLRRRSAEGIGVFRAGRYASGKERNPMPQRADLAGAVLSAFLLLCSVPAVADDLTGAQSFLCATREIFACAPGENCKAVDPAELNVPDFLVVDLAGRQLRTTAASGENRTSAIQQLSRDAGLLFLQGVDNGRAWSFLIDEESGSLTASVAREALSVSAFGVCTPTPAAKP
jgi:hypothetical protein